MIKETYTLAGSPVLYQNQINKFADIQRDYSDVNNYAQNYQSKINNIEKIQGDYFEKRNKTNTGSELRSLLDVIPTARRIERVPDKIEKKDYIPAAGLASLAVLNLPEDFRDTKQSFEQVKAKATGKEFNNYPYDYKTAQHPFSFFKGTGLHNFVHFEKSPFPKLGQWLVKNDTTFYDTKLGKMVNKFFDITVTDVDTGIESLNKNAKVVNGKRIVQAHKFETKSLFGELTARALTRTTKIGAMVLGYIEAFNFASEVRKGKDAKKELAQSAVSYTGNLVGIGYGGAIGAKYFGPVGSIVGMGLGALTANKVSKHIDT